MEEDKIKSIVDQTGIDPATARAALETAGGDVDTAVRIIRAYHLREDDPHPPGDEEPTSRDTEDPRADDIFEAIEEVWRKGNASHLEVVKDGKTILRLSLTVSAIGLILAPLAALIGLGAALITDYKITITLENGTVVDINEFALKRKQDQEEAGKGS